MTTKGHVYVKIPLNVEPAGDMFTGWSPLVPGLLVIGDTPKHAAQLVQEAIDVLTKRYEENAK